jgi:RNA polymerase sigma factor for flagellar operon FliA
MQPCDAIHLSQPNPAPALPLTECLPMVSRIARRIHRRLPPSVDFEEVYSAGVVGLMESSLKFDPAKNIPFASFAQFRVQGAILDSLRKADWAPRSLRRRGRVMDETIQALSLRLGRSPFTDEVAAEMEMSLKTCQQLQGELAGLDTGLPKWACEEDFHGEALDQIPSQSEDDPLLHCLRNQTRERLAKAIEELPERERLVLTLCYFEELNRDEIAMALGVSETRVHQIRAAAVAKLRLALSDFSQSAGQRRVEPRDVVKMPDRKAA